MSTRAPLAPIGWPERHRAAVHVDPLPVPAQLPSVGDGLHRERLVRLDQIVVADRACRPAPSARAPRRTGAKNRSRGSPPPVAYAVIRAIGVEPVRLRVRERGDDQRAGAVVEPRRVARRHAAAVLPERRLELGERLRGRVLPRRLVGVDDRRPSPARDLDRHDLALELAPPRPRATAFRWLSSANASCSCRLTPALSAVYSACPPMWQQPNEHHRPSWIMPSTMVWSPTFTPLRMP